MVTDVPPFHNHTIYHFFTIPPVSSFFSLVRTTFYHRYGPASKNSESAINILLDIVQDQSGKQYKMDHYATRYPTNVVDIAKFLVRLCK